MKIYSVSSARAHLAKLLDAAERGERAVIGRRGVRDAITVEEPVPNGTARRPRLEIVDEHVEAGAWSWSWSSRGLRLRGSPRRKT